MIISYSVPVFYIGYLYQENGSVSDIIKNQRCNIVILISMIIMGFFTMIYEYQREGKAGLLFIFILLCGIYGVICVPNVSIKDGEPNNLHYIFATLVFISIIGFMLVQWYCRKEESILYLLLRLQILLMKDIVMNIRGNIFFYEVGLIGNFAVYYLYLHFLGV
jgi:hypothetical protein